MYPQNNHWVDLKGSAMTLMIIRLTSSHSKVATGKCCPSASPGPAESCALLAQNTVLHVRLDLRCCDGDSSLKRCGHNSLMVA